MINILIFNRGYTPAKTYGGPVVSISNLVRNLHNKINFTVVANSTEINSKQNIAGIQVNEFEKGEFSEDTLFVDKKHYNYKFISHKLNKKNKFDLIYVNSFFDFKQLIVGIKLSQEYKIPLLIAPRGELEKNALNIKKYKKLPYIFIMSKIISNKNIFFQATTEDELKYTNKLLNISRERIIMLENIPSLSDISLENNLKKKNYLNICFISRIQTKKNLDYALTILGRINSQYKINFDIYGPIENRKYWEKCLKIIDGLPSNIKINYNGIIDHDKIIKTFSQHELFLFPTKSENFGHVIAESLSANCPVLISDQTPWNDINDTGAGMAIPLDNIDLFVKEVEKLASKNSTDFEVIRGSIKNYLTSKLNVEKIVKSYLIGFKYILGNEHL